MNHSLSLEEYTEQEILNALDYLFQEGFITAEIRNGEPYLIISDGAENL